MPPVELKDGQGRHKTSLLTQARFVVVVSSKTLSLTFTTIQVKQENVKKKRGERKRKEELKK